MPITANEVRRAVQALGYNTRADAYSRAKSRPHIKVDQYPAGAPVRVTVALAEVTAPSEIDAREEDTATAAYVAESLRICGYVVDPDPQCGWILIIDKEN